VTFGFVATPIYRTLRVELTNLKPVPITIENYAVDSENTNGIWERVDSVPIIDIGETRGAFYFGNDLKSVTEIKYQSFDSAVQSKSIASGEVVSGWLFLGNPKKGWNNSKGLRFRLNDNFGNISVEPIGREQSAYLEFGRDVQQPGMEGTTNVMDISRLVPPNFR